MTWHPAYLDDPTIDAATREWLVAGDWIKFGNPAAAEREIDLHDALEAELQIAEGMAPPPAPLREHLGPGPHPSGSPQAVHGGKGGAGSIIPDWRSVPMETIKRLDPPEAWSAGEYDNRILKQRETDYAWRPEVDLGSLDANVAAAIAACHGLRRERAFLLDRVTGKVLLGVEGAEHTVAATKLGDDRGIPDGHIMVHNHPLPFNPLSPGDVANAIERGRVTIAVDATGNVFRFDPAVTAGVGAPAHTTAQAMLASVWETAPAFGYVPHVSAVDARFMDTVRTGVLRGVAALYGVAESTHPWRWDERRADGSTLTVEAGRLRPLIDDMALRYPEQGVAIRRLREAAERGGADFERAVAELLRAIEAGIDDDTAGLPPELRPRGRGSQTA